MPSSISSLSHKLYEVVNEALNFFIRELDRENRLEIDEYESLMRLSFDLKKHSQFSDDFPVWRYGQKDKTFLFGSYTPDNRLIACLGLRICEIKIFGGSPPLANLGTNENTDFDKMPRSKSPLSNSIHVGIIGSVATHPDFRNKGIASRLLMQSEDLAKKHDVRQLFIWGSDERLYIKNGYARGGLQLQVKFDPPIKETTSLPKGCSIEMTRSLKQEHFNYLRSLDRPGLLMAKDDFSWISKHRNIDWFFLRKESEQGKEITAHAAINKGIDLPGYIHDFGSSDSSLLCIRTGQQTLDPLNLVLATIADRYDYAELLIHPNDLHLITLKYHAHDSDPSALFLTKAIATDVDLLNIWFWGTQSA